MRRSCLVSAAHLSGPCGHVLLNTLDFGLVQAKIKFDRIRCLQAKGSRCGSYKRYLMVKQADDLSVSTISDRCCTWLRCSLDGLD
jgi:hypothetical protein